MQPEIQKVTVFNFVRAETDMTADRYVNATLIYLRESNLLV